MQAFRIIVTVILTFSSSVVRGQSSPDQIQKLESSGDTFGGAHRAGEGRGGESLQRRRPHPIRGVPGALWRSGGARRLRQVARGAAEPPATSNAPASSPVASPFSICWPAIVKRPRAISMRTARPLARALP